MVRNTLILSVMVLMTACSAVPTKTDVQYVDKPFLICPAPPATGRPSLLIDSLSESDKQDPGKVVQAYKATVRQLIDYSQELETIIQRYDQTSKEYDELRKLVDEKFPPTK